MYYEQVKNGSSVQDWRRSSIAYTALINVRKNYMITFIDIEGFDKIQHPFMILRKHSRRAGDVAQW